MNFNFEVYLSIAGSKWNLYALKILSVYKVHFVKFQTVVLLAGSTKYITSTSRRIERTNVWYNIYFASGMQTKISQDVPLTTDLQVCHNLCVDFAVVVWDPFANRLHMALSYRWKITCIVFSLIVALLNHYSSQDIDKTVITFRRKHIKFINIYVLDPKLVYLSYTVKNISR